MTEPPGDLLDVVVAELERRTGDLPALSRETGISYDTVLRIKRRSNDPGYSKVRRLAEAMGLRVTVRHAEGVLP